MRHRFSPDALIGTTLRAGRGYRLRQRLASGGLAHVFLGETEEGDTVAVKLLRPELEDRRDVVARFEREALAACRIRHENVLHVFEPVQRAGDHAFFSAEHLVGVDLADALASQGRLSASRAVRVALGVARGLAAAHAAGVVHRDVKPENIFLVHMPDGRERVKLLDFGTAALSTDPTPTFDRRITQTTTFVGTPGYLAPEQAEGEPGRPPADIYGLGVVLYECLAGRPPFSGRNWAELLHLHAHASVTPPPGLSRELSSFLLRCMQKRPADRFTSMEEAAVALAGVKEHRP